MALPNRQVTGYRAKQGLNPRGGGSLISAGAGKRQLGRGLTALGVGVGSRLQETRGTAARNFEGVSAGLDYFAENFGNAVLKYADDTARMSATEQHTRLTDELGKIWLGYNEKQLQPDGSYKDVFIPGYANSQGESAVKGYGAYEEAIRAKYAELTDSLSPAEQKYFIAMSANTLTGFLNNGRQHASASHTEWSNQTLDMEKARISRGVNDMLVKGDTNSVLAYLEDSFKILGSQFPVNPAEAEKRKNEILLDVSTYLSTQDQASNKVKLFRDSLTNEVSVDTYVKMTKLYQQAIDRELAEAERRERQALRADALKLREGTKKFWSDVHSGELFLQNDIDQLFQGGYIDHRTKDAAYKRFGYEDPFLISNFEKLTAQEKATLETEIFLGTADEAEIVERVPRNEDLSHYFTLLRQTRQYNLRESLSALDDEIKYTVRRAPGIFMTDMASFRAKAMGLFMEEKQRRLKNGNNIDPDHQTILRKALEELGHEREAAIFPPGDIQVNTADPAIKDPSVALNYKRVGKLIRQRPKDELSLDAFTRSLLSMYGVKEIKQLPPSLLKGVIDWRRYFKTQEQLKKNALEAYQ